MIQSSHIENLLERWTKDANDLKHRFNQDALAYLTTEHMKELRDALLADSEGTMTVRAGATLSGFCEDHIGRLVRVGTIKNYGRKGAPRVRSCDLPIKTSRLRQESLDTTHSPRKRIVLAARNGDGA